MVQPSQRTSIKDGNRRDLASSFRVNGTSSRCILSSDDNLFEKPKKGVINKLNVFRILRTWKRVKVNKASGDNFVGDENQDDEALEGQSETDLQLVGNSGASFYSVTEATTMSVSTPGFSSATDDESLGMSCTTPTKTVPQVSDHARKQMMKPYRPVIASDGYGTNRDDDDMDQGNHRMRNPVTFSTREGRPTIRHTASSLSRTSFGILTKEDIDACSLQEYFDRMLAARCYSTETYATLATAYHNDATPLQEASYSSFTVRLVKTGDTQQLRTMLSCGLSPNPSNYYGESLLHIACRMGHAELVGTMLECGAIVQVSGKSLFRIGECL
jgi:hypothetical protein